MQSDQFYTHTCTDLSNNLITTWWKWSMMAWYTIFKFVFLWRLLRKSKIWKTNKNQNSRDWKRARFHTLTDMQWSVHDMFFFNQMETHLATARSTSCPERCWTFRCLHPKLKLSFTQNIRPSQDTVAPNSAYQKHPYPGARSPWYPAMIQSSERERSEEMYIRCVQILVIRDTRYDFSWLNMCVVKRTRQSQIRRVSQRR